MGVLCSIVDKNGDDPLESKTQNQNHISSSNRLHKLPHFSHSQKSTNINMTPEEYNRQRETLVKEERDQEFDAECTRDSSDIERRAAQIVRDIRAYDRVNTFHDPSPDSRGGPQADHFLANLNRINKSKLFRVAKKMPKGAHLHIHFNSCLSAEFLVKQARNIEAMYIRSTVPLISSENFDSSRISFNVLTEHEATHEIRDGNEVKVKLGDCFSKDYISNRWMRYSDFQRIFERRNVAFLSPRPAEHLSRTEHWLVDKLEFSENEAHGIRQTGRGIWERFNYRTQLMKGLFAYESAYKNYTRACIRDFVADNIQYAEIRPNFMAANTLKSDDGINKIDNEGIMSIIQDELAQTMSELETEGEYFGGMKVIYCTPRSFNNKAVEQSLNECISLKKKYSDLICGFDLVGHEEMGKELKNFVPEFLAFRQKCEKQKLDLPFLFHCGETLQVGDEVDGNLFDAVLLGSKRIGHGYALARHPVLMKKFKEKGIAIESCPISNEILGLTPNIAAHNLPILLANNVPCTVNSDNATFYRSSLSHDFYQVMVGSESMNLLGWKQLAIWSLEHSCMEPDMKAEVTGQWKHRWDEFCKWIVDEYDDDEQLKAWRNSSLGKL